MKLFISKKSIFIKSISLPYKETQFDVWEVKREWFNYDKEWRYCLHAGNQNKSAFLCVQIDAGIPMQKWPLMKICYQIIEGQGMSVPSLSCMFSAKSFIK